MPYFFKESAGLMAESEITLDQQDVHHACRVLKLAKGAAVTVADGRGAAFQGVICSAGPREVVVRLIEPAEPHESSLQITLLQSLAKGEKMDLIIRQAVELGAARVVPMATERSIPQFTASREVGRLKRWQKISQAAAAQCRRARLPRIEPVCRFEQVLDMARHCLSIVPWEMEKKQSLFELLRQPRPKHGAILLCIGPEGGFSRGEIESLTAAGAVSVHLGPRILRAETAAITALAMVQSAWGDLGPAQES
ncbi:MAG: 16S rRNA (uracil(1498)-N(3))-methyltransferase [Dethiobacter sp.]|jgi:16S rRNA (uracil1498-N3)-methyltransferase|nr:16S rRNA (uracil(1498)-N(3))-methyltransferase [Dethiobacter sp.]